MQFDASKQAHGKGSKLNSSSLGVVPFKEKPGFVQRVKEREGKEPHIDGGEHALQRPFDGSVFVVDLGSDLLGAAAGRQLPRAVGGQTEGRVRYHVLRGGGPPEGEHGLPLLLVAVHPGFGVASLPVPRVVLLTSRKGNDGRREREGGRWGREGEKDGGERKKGRQEKGRGCGTGWERGRSGEEEGKKS